MVLGQSGKNSGSVVLPPRQYAILKIVVENREVSVESIADKLGKKVSDLMRDFEELKEKGLIQIVKEQLTEVRISEAGRKYLLEGAPEVRILNLVKERAPISLKELAEASGLTQKEFSAALGILRRLGIITVDRGMIKYEGNDAPLLSYSSAIADKLKSIGDGKLVSKDKLVKEYSELRRRGLIVTKTVSKIYVKPTSKALKLYEAGLIREAPVITALTSEMIVRGAWRGAIFKKFDLKLEPPALPITRKHPYIQFLNYVRQVVISMGFEEVKGPHVESELWNFDVLFVPQYHPSRRESDVYFIKNKGLSTYAPRDVIERTREIHEVKLGYKWDARKALNLILRTHTTAVSMRTIYSRGEGEYRAFSLDRVFRPDTPDSTHLMEFHQLEGIIVGRNVTFRDLLGFFKEFARALGLGDVKFRPAYFPFTEPSVEGYIKHPRLGWIEVFPGGMFRPEVLKPLGLEGYNVAAWGIGIDRIAMIVLGIDDIRDLYTCDLSVINSMKVPEVIYK